MKTNMHFGASSGIFRRASQLRNHPTKAEDFLWQYLRKNQMGQRFRRQHPIWECVVDFYCHALGLIIEVDGGVHEEEEQRLKDQEKTNALLNMGLHIIRFSNEQVLLDLDHTLSLIADKIKELEYDRYKEKNKW